MVLGEPTRTQWDIHFSVLGFPVRIHPLFWIVMAVFGLNGSQQPDMRMAIVSLTVWVLAAFLSILVHELGHALVMRHYGFSPWITLHGFGGLASYNPAQSQRLRGSGMWGQVAISAAGPGAGFLLAALVIGLLKLTGHRIFFAAGFPLLFWIGPAEPLANWVLNEFVRNVLFICIFWGILNLLPIYPLDGGQIAREILLKVVPRDGIRFSLMLSIFTAACLAIFALTQLHSTIMAIFFGYMGYINFQTLQAYQGRGRW